MNAFPDVAVRETAETKRGSVPLDLPIEVRVILGEKVLFYRIEFG